MILTITTVVCVAALHALMSVAAGTLTSSLLAARAFRAGRVEVTGASCAQLGPDVALQSLQKVSVVIV